MAREDSHRLSAASASGSHVSAYDLPDASEVRPASAHTLRSAFADSAVGMDATTPAELPDTTTNPGAEYFEPMVPLTPNEVDQTLSDKMRRLAAVAWQQEQDDSMTAERRQSLHERLHDLEAYLETETAEELEHAPGEERTDVDAVEEQQDGKADTQMDITPAEADDDWIDESELVDVRENLAATVQSMRLRHEEQRHLHQLTVQKLEAVAQRCIAQEQQVQNILNQVRELHLQNQTLTTENDQLRENAANLEVDASRNEVAVEAMSSAVKGLEGWIETAHPSRAQTPTTTRHHKVVTRGKGRFRGRYYVDEDGDEAVACNSVDAASDSQELHDGVKAWLRGFRDVEEQLRDHESPLPSTRNRPQGRFRVLDHGEDGEWGDFETPGAQDAHGIYVASPSG